MKATPSPMKVTPHPMKATPTLMKATPTLMKVTPPPVVWVSMRMGVFATGMEPEHIVLSVPVSLLQLYSIVSGLWG